jgi:hypothetical protein
MRGPPCERRRPPEFVRRFLAPVLADIKDSTVTEKYPRLFGGKLPAADENGIKGPSTRQRGAIAGSHFQRYLRNFRRAGRRTSGSQKTMAPISR